MNQMNDESKQNGLSLNARLHLLVEIANRSHVLPFHGIKWRHSFAIRDPVTSFDDRIRLPR
jgi:hypothetical protein